MQTRFPFFAYCLGKYRFSENRAPFAPLDPASQQHLSSSPRAGALVGNLRCCCSAGFRLRRAALLEKLPQVFLPLLFSSRLFLFFLSHFFTGHPRLPSSPLPSRLFSPFPDPLDFGALQEGHIKLAALEASATAAQLSDPNSIGCVKIPLRLFSRRVKTLSLATLFADTNLQSRTSPSKA